MDFDSIMRARRSVRDYKKDAQVTRKQLEKVLQAGQWAPSWKNGQSFSYIVVSDRALIAKLGEICKNNACSAAFQTASYILVLCGDPEKSGRREGKDYYLVDAGIAFQQSMLAAAEEGLGMCWIGAFSEQPVKELLQIPYHIRVVALSPLGVANSYGNPQPRRSMQEFASENGWHQPISFE